MLVLYNKVINRLPSGETLDVVVFHLVNEGLHDLALLWVHLKVVVFEGHRHFVDLIQQLVLGEHHVLRTVRLVVVRHEVEVYFVLDSLRRIGVEHLNHSLRGKCLLL